MPDIDKFGKSYPLPARDYCLETTLVQDGVAKAVVVIGSDPAHAQAAKEIVQKVETSTGARLPVVRDDEKSAEELFATHVIALGNMADNRFIRWLYHRWWAVEDRWYPGAGGYALRTLHNPTGRKTNVVTLGASDAEGLRRVTDRFLALIPEGRTLTLGRLMEIEAAEALRFQRPPKGWIAERREDFTHRATRLHASESGAGYELISEAGAHGLMYYKTGYPEYAEAFREVFLAHRLMPEPGQMAHFHVWWWATVWDLIEESPVFTDEDRVWMTQHLLWIMGTPEGAYYPFLRDGAGNPMVRQNHQTLVGMAVMFAGRYFGTHYGIEETQEWQALARELFRGQAVSFKPIEDANSYQWMTLDHMLTYTLATGDTLYVDNGQCRKSLDQAVFYCNNLGSLPAFGDTGEPLGGYPVNFLIKAGHVLQDGRAEFLLRLRYATPTDYFGSRRARYEEQKDPYLVRSFEKYFCDGLQPVVPKEFEGVHALEVAGGFYEFAKNPKARPREVKPLNIPREQGFDTVCFREGFGRDDQYLMLHGIGYGNHAHDDGNSIVEFSANERIFLVDASYTEGPTLKHHNAVTAVRDGEPCPLPALCSLDALSNLDRIGFSQTTMDGSWGARWTRNLLWRKGGWFVVFDRVTATQAGAFALQCHWRTLGTPTLTGDDLEVVQRDPKSGREDRFVLRGSGGDRTSMERDWENFGHWWGAYPYADDFVNILHQSATRQMEAGESHTFLNLFYASNDQKPLACDMRRVGASAAEVLSGPGDEGYLVGVGDADSAFDAKGLSVRAALFSVSAEGFALCEGSEVSNGTPVFTSDHPVSIAYDMKTGDGVVESKTGARLSLILGRAGLVAVDGKVVNGRVLETYPDGDRRVSFEVPVGRHQISATRAQFRLSGIAGLPAWREQGGRVQQAAKAPRLRRVWSFEAGSGIRAVDGIGDRVFCGTMDGRVVALEAKGRAGAPVWTFRAKGPVNSVRVADVDGDGRVEVLVGSDDRHLYALNEKGKVKWMRRFEKYEGTWDRYARNAEVARVEVADLDGDGRLEVLAAVSDRQLHCLDGEGGERWSFMIYGIFDPLRVADVDGDGRPEIVGGPGRITCNGTCYVLDAGGRQVNTHPTDGWASMLSSCDVAPLGEGVLIAAGTTRGTLYALDPSQKPMGVRWTRKLGDDVTALALTDVDGDGFPEVVAGSSCFYLYLLNSDGTERWRRNLRAGVRSVLATDLDGDGRPEIVAGCDDGRISVLGADGTERAFHPGAGFGCVRTLGGMVLVGEGAGALRALALG